MGLSRSPKKKLQSVCTEIIPFAIKPYQVCHMCTINMYTGKCNALRWILEYNDIMLHETVVLSHPHRREN